jgi:hypothetical protein
LFSSKLLSSHILSATLKIDVLVTYNFMNGLVWIQNVAYYLCNFDGKVATLKTEAMDGIKLRWMLGK